MINRPAFTLIELLIVISIMALLAALTVSAVQSMRQAAKKQQTQTIMQTVQQGLRQISTERGGAISGAEHPFANSLEPRFGWIRGASPNDGLSTSGEALRGVWLSNLSSSDQSRLQLRDDCFADPAAPNFYGLSRDKMSILGAPQSNTTRYRVLPIQPNKAMVISNPDLTGRIVNEGGAAKDTTELYQALFGKTGALETLGKLKGLQSPAEEAPTNDLLGGKIWSATSSNSQIKSTFRVMIGSVAHAYRIRPLGLYDAWGNDILYSLSERGDTIRMLSAGRDGAFVFHPGPNGTFDTQAANSTPSGDDRDGTRDNVGIGWDQ